MSFCPHWDKHCIIPIRAAPPWIDARSAVQQAQQMKAPKKQSHTHIIEQIWPLNPSANTIRQDSGGAPGIYSICFLDKSCSDNVFKITQNPCNTITPHYCCFKYAWYCIHWEKSSYFLLLIWLCFYLFFRLQSFVIIQCKKQKRWRGLQ